MNLFTAFIIFFILLIFELSYFRIAQKYHIFDIPNSRSLHQKAIIRGGGIIFPLSALLFFVYSQMQFPYFILGLFLISTISLLDDLYSIQNRYRLAIQFLSVCLLLYQIAPFNQYGFWVVLWMILFVGIINAYNFMDGINGITGGYSLVNLLSLLYINNYQIEFVSNELIIFIVLAVLVFNLFNFRRVARCFAGDVGSVSIGFITIFFLIQLIFKTNHYIYIFFLSIYGIDTIFTIIVRLWEKENIFKPHKKHLFQLLVDKLNLSHLLVTLIYISTQAIINILILSLDKNDKKSLLFLISILGVISFLYAYCRIKINKSVSTVK